MSQIAKLFDHLMFFVADELLDDLWTPIVPGGPLRQTAANVAFFLAFINQFDDIDDQATLASKPRVRFSLRTVRLSWKRQSFRLAI